MIIYYLCIIFIYMFYNIFKIFFNKILLFLKKTIFSIWNVIETHYKINGVKI